MNRLTKKLISIVITCMMVITLVPFTGSNVNASSIHNVGKISLKLAPGSLIQPGYDEDVPSVFSISLDETDDSSDVIAMNSKKIKVSASYWCVRDVESWGQFMGPADDNQYRMCVILTSNADSTSDEFIYKFIKNSTSVYVDGEKWEIPGWGWEEGEIYALGPVCNVEEGTTSVYKEETQPIQQPTTQPTQQPANQPTQQPANQPTQQPTAQPTQQPTAQPTQQPTAQPTAQPTQQPTNQPANQQSDVSTKITGAPKNLVCSISKGNARQIDVEFDPNLECGIDKNCGVVIAASTDNKATWQKVEGWDFVSGNKDLKWNTYALSGSTYFKMDLEKTYYVKAYYVDSEGKKGPDSNICGPFGPVEDESKIPGKVEEASKVAVKTTGNDAGVLKKGTSVTFERAFYKLTATVKDIKGSDIIFTVNLEPNKPYDSYMAMSHGSIRYTDKNGKPYDMMDIFGETTIDISDMAMGCTKITIPVTAELRQKYDRNQKKYKFEETFYFDAAPLAPSLGLTKADKKSITLGKAYSATVNCTDSGTTVYYKKKGASKWKEKTFAKGSSMKLSGLSAGSSYQIKAVNYVKSKDRNGKEKTIKSNESNVSVFRTAYKSAPKIKSVKTSKVKQKTKKFKGQWVPSGKTYKWQKPYSLKVTTYKLTIKMKSKPTNAAGMIIKDPDGVVHVIKGAKSKYTLSGEIKGYKKGQTVKFKVATFGNGDTYDKNSGVSPYKTINVTLR